MNPCLRLAATGLLLAASLGVSASTVRAADAPRLPSEELLTNPRAANHRFDDFNNSFEERRAEVNEKVGRLRRNLAARRLDGVVITTERNFGWVTGGGKDHVVWAQRESPVTLFITLDKQYLIANNIEGPRVMTEELDGLGYQWEKYDWWEKETKPLAALLKGKKVAFDNPATAISYEAKPAESVFDFQEVYYPVTQGELKKYRWLGRKTSEVLEQVAPLVRPGMSERDVQALLAREFWYWDIFPTVMLTAVDERAMIYRQPVVQGANLKRYCSLSVCARRWGLVVAATRVLHFGEPPASLAKAWSQGPQLCAAMWSATRPGKTLGDVIDAARDTYGKIGFPNEWKLNHQGGMILGLERLYAVPPGDKTKIIPGMVLAWSPTLQGARFEDTVVVRDDGTLENLTAAIKWPTTEVKTGTATYKVPGLMIRPEPRE